MPELYGYDLGKSSNVPAIDNIFTFNPEEMFFLSLSSLSSEPLRKYSITKGKNMEFIYYTPYNEDIPALRTSLKDKI